MENENDPRLKRICIISKAQIRYEGNFIDIHTEDADNSVLALSNVRSFGTEDRQCERPVAAKSSIFPEIFFHSRELDAAYIVPAVMDDPCIMSIPMPPNSGPESELMPFSNTAENGNWPHDPTVGAKQKSPNAMPLTTETRGYGPSYSNTHQSPNCNIPDNRRDTSFLQDIQNRNSRAIGDARIEVGDSSSRLKKKIENQCMQKNNAPLKHVSERQNNTVALPKQVDNVCNRDNDLKNRTPRIGSTNHYNANTVEKTNYYGNLPKYSHTPSGRDSESRTQNQRTWDRQPAGGDYHSGYSNYAHNTRMRGDGMRRGRGLSRTTMENVDNVYHRRQERGGWNRHTGVPTAGGDTQPAFTGEYDYERANEELAGELKKMTLNEKFNSHSGSVEDGDKSDTSNADEEHVCYDKSKSFFDSISSELLERAYGTNRGGNMVRLSERRLNADTFGSAVQNMDRPRGRSSGYRGRVSGVRRGLGGGGRPIMSAGSRGGFDRRPGANRKEYNSADNPSWAAR